MKLIWCCDILWHLNVSAVGLCSPHADSSSKTERALTLQKRQGRWQNELDCQLFLKQFVVASWTANTSWELRLFQWFVACWGDRELEGRLCRKQSYIQIQMEGLKGRSTKHWSGIIKTYDHILDDPLWNCSQIFKLPTGFKHNMWGVCKMKPDISENSLNDWETECAYFINHFSCSAADVNAAAVGRRASSPTPARKQQLSLLATQIQSKQEASRAGGWSGLLLLLML